MYIMSHCLQLQYTKQADEHVKLALMWNELLLLVTQSGGDDVNMAMAYCFNPRGKGGNS